MISGQILSIPDMLVKLDELQKITADSILKTQNSEELTKLLQQRNALITQVTILFQSWTEEKIKSDNLSDSIIGLNTQIAALNKENLSLKNALRESSSALFAANYEICRLSESSGGFKTNLVEAQDDATQIAKLTLALSKVETEKTALKECLIATDNQLLAAKTTLTTAEEKARVAALRAQTAETQLQVLQNALAVAANVNAFKDLALKQYFDQLAANINEKKALEERAKAAEEKLAKLQAKEACSAPSSTSAINTSLTGNKRKLDALNSSSTAPKAEPNLVPIDNPNKRLKLENGTAKPQTATPAPAKISDNFAALQVSMREILEGQANQAQAEQTILSSLNLDLLLPHNSAGVS